MILSASGQTLGKHLLFSFILVTCIFQSVDIAVANTIIIDNGESATSRTGTWKVSSGKYPYGSDSLYTGNRGASYTYNINLAAPGEYQVFARWTSATKRRTDVPYAITHLNGTSTVPVNQRNNGGRWIQLGTSWNFGNTAIITINSLGNGSTCADAVKLVPINTNLMTNLPPVVSTIPDKTIVAGSTLQFNISATDADGSPPVLSADTLPSNAIFIDNNNGTGLFTWDTVYNDTGTYKVNFIATDTGDPTITGNTSATITVVENNSSVGSNSSSYILDNGEPGTSHSGTWKVSSGKYPYGSDSLYSGNRGASYTYNINLAAPGKYQVFARWTSATKRRTDVPYAIRHLYGTSTVPVNQRNNGGRWIQLGSTWDFDKQASVNIQSLGNGSTSADAVMLVPAGTNINSVIISNNGPSDVQPNSFKFHVDFENRARNSKYTTTHIIEDFNANSRDGGIRGPDWDNTWVVNDPANTGRGNVLRVRHKAGDIGTAMKFKARFAPDNEAKKGSARFDDVYFAFDFYLQPGYKPMMMHKLPGLMTGTLLEAGHATGVTAKPEGIVAFSSRVQSYSSGVFTGRPYEGALASYTYDAEKTSGFQFLDTANPTQQVSSRSYTLPQGRWITIEQRVKLNTADSNGAYHSSVDLKDGLVEIWIDGKKMLKRPHLWRWTNSMKADGLNILSHYNNTNTTQNLGQTAPPTDQFEYYDNFRVSTSPIAH